MTPQPVAASDAPLLAALHARCFPPAEAWGAEAIATMLELPGGFGCRDTERGFVLARAAAGEAELLTLAVVPAARRKGVGACLLAAALAGAVVRGAGCMFLEVAFANIPARALYAGAGFAQVGRRARYYASGDDALVLRRELAPP